MKKILAIIFCFALGLNQISCGIAKHPQASQPKQTGALVASGSIIVCAIGACEAALAAAIAATVVIVLYKGGEYVYYKVVESARLSPPWTAFYGDTAGFCASTYSYSVPSICTSTVMPGSSTLSSGMPLLASTQTGVIITVFSGYGTLRCKPIEPNPQSSRQRCYCRYHPGLFDPQHYSDAFLDGGSVYWYKQCYRGERLSFGIPSAQCDCN